MISEEEVYDSAERKPTQEEAMKTGWGFLARLYVLGDKF
jgi:hypothetical protein